MTYLPDFLTRCWSRLTGQQVYRLKAWLTAESLRQRRAGIADPRPRCTVMILRAPSGTEHVFATRSVWDEDEFALMLDTMRAVGVGPDPVAIELFLQTWCVVRPQERRTWRI